MAIGIPAAQLAALRKGMAAKPRKPIDTAAVDLLAFHVKAQRLPAPDREYRFAAMAVGGTGAGVKERLRKARLRDWRFDFAWPDQMWPWKWTAADSSAAGTAPAPASRRIARSTATRRLWAGACCALRRDRSKAGRLSTGLVRHWRSDHDKTGIRSHHRRPARTDGEG